MLKVKIVDVFLITTRDLKQMQWGGLMQIAVGMESYSCCIRNQRHNFCHGVLSCCISRGAESVTRFDGYSSTWTGEWSAEIDVYLDPNWGTGTGFDYSVAATGANGNHLRDFIFHVGTPDIGLLVNG